MNIKKHFQCFNPLNSPILGDKKVSFYFIKKAASVGILAAFLAASIVAQGAGDEVKIKVDEEKLECSVSPRIENGTTMVPMRAVFEALGMTVEWIGEEQKIVAANQSDFIVMTVGSNIMTCNGKNIALSVAPYVENGTAMVPIRAVSESVDAEVTWDGGKNEISVTTAEYAANKDKWKDNTGVIDITSMKVTGAGAEIRGNVVEITQGGDFEVLGTNDNAMIHIDTKYKVKLRLAGVNITNQNGPAIFFERSNKSFITVSKNTVNYINDGAEYEYEAKGAVFSDSDIEIKGGGTLYVTSKNHHAIAGDDDIKIEEGTLILSSEEKDGIHANNTVKILGGSVEITAKGDGIQAEEDVVIEGGSIKIVTTGDVAENADVPFERGIWGGQRPGGNRPPGNMPGDGETPPAPRNEPMGGFEQNRGGFPVDMPFTGGDITQNAENNSDEASSTKGIKAETNIDITGGKIEISSADHGIHSRGTINIKGGEIIVESAKGKGISGHGDVVLDGGRVLVTKSTEGIESKGNLTINGGEITVKASDDGINAGGTGGRDAVNRNNSEADTGHDILINGGTIFINASGDGIDANGKITVNGGNIVVEGPTNSGNGSLDSGGSIKVNGGELLALGTASMVETPDNDSKQPSFLVITENDIAPGTTIVIKDKNGEKLFSYVTVKSGNSIIFSSDKLKSGEQYTVAAGDKEYSFKMESNITKIGNTNNRFGGRMH